MLPVACTIVTQSSLLGSGANVHAIRLYLDICLASLESDSLSKLCCSHLLESVDLLFKLQTNNYPYTIILYVVKFSMSFEFVYFLFLFYILYFSFVYLQNFK